MWTEAAHAKLGWRSRPVRNWLEIEKKLPTDAARNPRPCSRREPKIVGILHIRKYTDRAAFDASDPEIAEICRSAIGALAETGMMIDARRGFPENADQHALLVLQAEAARQHRERIDDTRIDATLRKRLRKGLAISDGELRLALAARDGLRSDFVSRTLGDAIAVLLPVMPIRTPDVEEVDPVSAHFNPSALYALSRFTRFVNYLGLPALAVPAGFDRRGMPVGLQMVGRPGSEAALLAIGVALQAATDWHGRVPPAIAGEIVNEPGLKG